MAGIPQERLDQVLKRFELIEAQMAAGPDSATYVKLASEYSELEETALKVRELKAARAEHGDLEALLAGPGTDAEMAALAKEELPAVAERLEALENEIRILMLPRDTADSRNVILEIRAGTGGDEAALFAGDLFRMYERYAATRGWKIEVMSANEGE